MFSPTVQLPVASDTTVSNSGANPAVQNTSQGFSPSANPEDTVTLTAQPLGSQSTQPSPQSPISQVTGGPVLVAQAAASDERGENTSPRQTGTAASGASSVAPVAAGTNSPESSSAQQQLDQLEALLQQIGIDPASLSGPALTALLHDSADPAALLVYVKQLQGTAPPAAPPIAHVNVTV
jgi:hypothetical protein